MLDLTEPFKLSPPPLASVVMIRQHIASFSATEAKDEASSCHHSFSFLRRGDIIKISLSFK
jgi:hypothetical protein